MKTASHTFPNTIYGPVTVDLMIQKTEPGRVMIGKEVAYWQINATVNGTPLEVEYFTGNLGSTYYGEETETAARHFLALAHQRGILPPTQAVATPL